jgi:MFS family permease
MWTVSSTPTAAQPSLGPTAPVTPWWTTRFGLVWLGVWMAQLVPIQLALPDQLFAIDHAHRVRDFGLVNGLVGIAAIITLPLFGAMCDRTRSSLGRRRTWVAAGAVVFAVGLVLTGQQVHTGWLAACWVLASLGGNMMSAGLTAVVADDVPERQRGLISGAIYAPQGIGVVLGLAAVTGLSAHGRYWVLAVALLVLTVPFVLTHREGRVASAPPLRLRSVVAGLLIDPRSNPDFAWAFGGRLLVNVGNALGTTYFLFFLRDYLKVAHPDDSLFVMSLVYLAFTLVATVVGGVLSDRSGQRRRFVAVTATLQGLAGVLIVVHPTYDAALVGAALIGAGYGAFMSVDQALVTAVLPDADDRAKDLGIMNIGSVGPQMFGPVLASALITVAGYRWLYAVAGLLSILGAVMVFRIRSVR